ncbi:acyltransferase [Sphingobacterium sp. SGG-5]|uniref:acyltransferase family protein n=1 Tax=Sphingobacterium sp. SGG-5 TaxID=2710881 RepID=UPI0013EDC4A4|nr:acyltransferase [Sphingobacterium sp. SGG-5]
MYNNLSFFPNLNALRFFAALLVIFHHGEVIRAKNGFDAFESASFFLNGGSAVKFFFVLSGFLITYLLLKEKKKTRNIAIKNFYMRRIIRIWPLYFLLFFIGTVLFPSLFRLLHIDYAFPYNLSQSWVFFLLFIPSIVTFRYGSHLLEPLWSIGVEEWFYLLWAPLFKWTNKPLFLILTILLTKIGLLVAVNQHIIQNPLICHFITTYAFESMAFGGIGAYFLFYTKRNIQQLYHKYRAVNIFFLILLLGYIFLKSNSFLLTYFPLFESALFYWFFLNILFLNLIVYCAIVLPNTSWLNNKWLDIGGKISYGIYMYHMIIIFTVIFFLKPYLLTLSAVYSFLVFYISVISGTILAAYLSKKFFEDYFMQFRNRFM